MENKRFDFEFGDTTVTLCGEHDRLETVISIIISNPFSATLDIPLKEVGYVDQIRKAYDLKNALLLTVGYWNRQGLIDQRVKKDIRKALKNLKVNEREIKLGIDKFNQTNALPYERIPAFTAKRNKVHFVIRHSKYAIRFTFLLQKAHGRYKTILTINGDGKTKNFERTYKLMNCNSLIKQYEDWVRDLTDPVTDQMFIESKDLILGFLIDYKAEITDLINRINAR